MTPSHPTRLRYVAWACLLAVLLVAASPVSGGLPPAVLAPLAPSLHQPVAVAARHAGEAPRPAAMVVLRGIAARAPPLA